MFKKRGRHLLKYVLGLMLSVLLCFSYTVTADAASQELNLYGSEAAPNGERYKKTTDGVVAGKVKISRGKFTGVVVPSWYMGKISFAVIIYKWDTDYAKTAASSPLFAEAFEADAPGAWVDPGQQDFIVKFDRAFAEGEYLVMYRHVSDGPLYIPLKSAYDTSESYLNGNVIENTSYQFTCVADPDAALNDTPNIKIQIDESIYGLYGDGASADGVSNINAADFESVADKFMVSPTQGLLTGFIINDLYVPNGMAEITLSLYKWNTDYKTTIASNAVYRNIYDGESAASGGYENLKMSFGENAFAAGAYLVVLETTDSLNLWTHASKDGVTSYLDGEVYEGGTLKLSCIANEKAVLNEKQAETPTPAATPEKTDAPAAATPAATKAASTPTTAPESGPGKLTTILLIAICAAVVIAGAVVTVVILRRRKR